MSLTSACPISRMRSATHDPSGNSLSLREMSELCSTKWPPLVRFGGIKSMWFAMERDKAAPWGEPAGQWRQWWQNGRGGEPTGNTKWSLTMGHLIWAAGGGRALVLPQPAVCFPKCGHTSHHKQTSAKPVLKRDAPRNTLRVTPLIGSGLSSEPVCTYVDWTRRFAAAAWEQEQV